MNIQALMKQAQSLQKDMVKAKDEIDNMIFVGESSFVKVEVKGTKEIVKISIDGDISNDDKDMLEDMITVAINQAFKQVDDETEKKLGKFSNAMPGMF